MASVIKMKRTKFTPEIGTEYENISGGTYKCLSSGNGLPIGCATMQNTKSRWTFIAHGIGIYDDGTIDWDYSTSGCFQERSE